MKFKLVLTLILILGNNFSYAVPTQETVDKLVMYALNSSEKELAGTKGRYTCGYAVMYNDLYNARSTKQEDATLKSQLLCIKDQCSKIGARVKVASDQITRDKSEDVDALLEALGYTEEERETFLKSYQQKVTSTYSEKDCITGTPLTRMTVVDMCLTVPMECEKKFF